MKRIHSAPVFVFSALAAVAVAAACSSDSGGSGDGNTPGTGGASGGNGTGGASTGGASPATGGSSPGGAGSGGSGSGGEGVGGSSTGGDGNGDEEPMGSPGCGTPTQHQTGSWVVGSGNSGVGNRTYDVRLPNGYNPDRLYPLILLLHGCGSGTNNVPMENEAGNDAIVIRGLGSGNDSCWGSRAVDLPYVDGILDDVQDRFCVNPEQVFAVGYSSGSWFASMLSCARGDVFRGIGSVAGGEPDGEIHDCVGQVGRMFIHDQNDEPNQLDWDVPSRDRMIATNNCSNSSMPVAPSPCVEYQDCDPGYPVVWCETSGQGHGRQDGLAVPGFWNFFKRLMNE